MFGADKGKLDTADSRLNGRKLRLAIVQARLQVLAQLVLAGWQRRQCAGPQRGSGGGTGARRFK